MNSIIRAIGIANPSNCFDQIKIFDFMCQAHSLSDTEASRLKKIYDVSGISRRFSVLDDFDKTSGFNFFKNAFPSTKQRADVYEQEAVRLAADAVGSLFSKLPDFDKNSITHLITVSCTGMYAPGLDIDLIEHFGLNTDIERTCINFMGCYGAFNALKTADYICRAQPQSVVLIADVELCTLHFQNENTLDNWIANSLFGDGAAAVLVEAYSKEKTGFQINSFYTELALEAKDEMAWRIGDTGFEMRLSSRIAKNIQSKINVITEKLLKKSGLEIGAINRLAIHPGGRRILEVCAESLGFERSKVDESFAVLNDFGNMSSATVLFVLERMMENAHRKENILSFAFGPGLTVESMSLQKI